VIEGVSYFKDATLAHDLAAETDWKRRNLYLGPQVSLAKLSPVLSHSPQYDRLVVTLQDKFEEFLKERGIGDELAAFIPDYAEWKEQKVSQ
jgi:complement component 1 Q subcomponent-binding protein